VAGVFDITCVALGPAISIEVIGIALLELSPGVLGKSTENVDLVYIRFDHIAQHGDIVIGPE
jgi:hypothetical protein